MNCGILVVGLYLVLALLTWTLFILARGARSSGRGPAWRTKECDHLFFPVMRDGKLVGQQCKLCPQFNDLKTVDLNWQKISERWTDEERIAHNESIIAASKAKSYFGRVQPEDAKLLIAHPTIMCRFNRTKEELDAGNYGAGWYLHGTQHAVWLKDMRHPECASCLVEDPYE